MLFKEGIEPKWEDSANREGGRWLLTTVKNKVTLNSLQNIKYLKTEHPTYGEQDFSQLQTIRLFTWLFFPFWSLPIGCLTREI